MAELARFYLPLLVLLVLFAVVQAIAFRKINRLKNRLKDLRHRPLDAYVVGRKIKEFPMPLKVTKPAQPDSAIGFFLKDYAVRDDNLSRQRHYMKYFEGCGQVLDIGCGNGEFLQLCAEKGVKAVGIDLSEDKVRVCRENGLEAHCVDVFSFLGESRRKFDGIMCSHVFEHLEAEEVIALTRLASETLNMNGIFLIVTPNPRSLNSHLFGFWKDMSHKRFYDVESLSYMLEKSGFEIVDVAEYS